MALVNILHMNNGDEDSSYATNSFLQEEGIQKAVPYLKQAIKGIMANQGDVFFDHCFIFADLGCATGLNTLSVASNIIHTVHQLCKENNRKPPQFHFSLNDLFGNDFNSIFKLLPNFYDNLYKDKGEDFGSCFVSAVPGSFYGRLYPDKSLHFVHSSYSLHWLSQVPHGLENNTLNVYIAKASPVDVLQAYAKQFDTDFTKFLQLRSKELVRGGCMFFTLVGRSLVDPTMDDCCVPWELLAITLLDMLKEGLVREWDINSFNFPFYIPCEDELRNIIQHEGSFCLDSMDIYEVDWDPRDVGYLNSDDYNEPSHRHSHGKNMVKVIRAVTEPLLASHFGNSIIDVLYNKYEKHLKERLAIKKPRQFSIVISLTKK